MTQSNLSLKIVNIYLFAIIAFVIIGLFITNVRIDKSHDELTKRVDSIYYTFVDTFERNAFLVSLTTYNAVASQCDATPDLTASGLKINSKSKYVALSRDLLEEIPYGSIVTLQNAGKLNGDYVVADCMNKRHFRTIDVLVDNKKVKNTSMSNVVLILKQ